MPVEKPQTVSNIIATTMTLIILWRLNWPKNIHPKMPTISIRNPMMEPKAIKNSTDSATLSK